MRAAPIALITALLPFLCVHLTYLLAASHGHVDWCVPYWDSCTSISATGRQLPEKLLFKFIMIPVGLLVMLFWWLVNGWLTAVGLRRSYPMFWSGAVAGLCLILYVVALGEGRDYQTLRRSGIILFFSLSFLAQLLFLARSLGARATLAGAQARSLGRQQAAALLLLAIGITSVLLDLFYANYDGIEDAFEWVMLLFIIFQFASHRGLWKTVDLRIELRPGAP